MEYAIGVRLAILADLFLSWAGLDKDRFATPDAAGRALLMRAGEAGGLTARGWTRTLRLARTIADLDGCDGVLRRHIAEALVYRRSTVGAPGRFREADGSTRQSAGLPDSLHL